jgi:hypothetical protein
MFSSKYFFESRLDAALIEYLTLLLSEWESKTATQNKFRRIYMKFTSNVSVAGGCWAFCI